MSDLIEQLIRRVSSGENILEADNWFGGSSEPTTKAFPLATPKQIARSEARLGFALPSLYREVLTRVGNGGFGPGYGLLGVEGGAGEVDETSTAIDLYRSFCAKPKTPAWPRKVIPICPWGCEIYSCLDCSTDDGPVIAFDPGRKGNGPWRRDYKIHVASFSEWLTRWLRDEKMFDSMPLNGEPYFAFEDQ